MQVGPVGWQGKKHYMWYAIIKTIPNRGGGLAMNGQILTTEHTEHMEKAGMFLTGLQDQPGWGKVASPELLFFKGVQVKVLHLISRPLIFA